MPCILIDTNIEGHCERLWKRMQTPAWQDFTTGLDVTFHRFHEFGLDAGTPDDVVWRFCQQQGFYLLTSNRNHDSEVSLEATIRREGKSTNLPVFTLPLPDRVYDSPAFVERVIDKLFSLLLDADNLRGIGRLFLP